MHVTAALWIARSVRLQSKHNLKTIIPSIFASSIPLVNILTSVPTSPYHLKDSMPPMDVHPYRIIHHPSLANRLMSSLRKYLEASPTGYDRPSTALQHFIDFLPTTIESTSTLLPSLVDETSSTNFCFDRVISRAVKQIGISYPRFLREDTSPSVFLRHTPKIVEMGRGGHRWTARIAVVPERYRVESQIDFARGQPISFFFCSLPLRYISDQDNYDWVNARTYSVCNSLSVGTSLCCFRCPKMRTTMAKHNLVFSAQAPLIPSPIQNPSATLGQAKKVRKKRTRKPKIFQSFKGYIPKEVCSDFGESLISPAKVAYPKDTF
jgi:hypothetical protein